MAWFGLVAALVHNYVQHRRGRPTICSVTRRVLPRPVSAAGLGIGFVVLVVHVWRGYAPRVLEHGERR